MNAAAAVSKHNDPYLDYDYSDRSGYGCSPPPQSSGGDPTALTLGIIVGGAIVTYILRQAIITNIGAARLVEGDFFTKLWTGKISLYILEHIHLLKPKIYTKEHELGFLNKI